MLRKDNLLEAPLTRKAAKRGLTDSPLGILAKFLEALGQKSYCMSLKAGQIRHLPVITAQLCPGCSSLFQFPCRLTRITLIHVREINVGLDHPCGLEQGLLLLDDGFLRIEIRVDLSYFSRTL